MPRICGGAINTTIRRIIDITQVFVRTDMQVPRRCGGCALKSIVVVVIYGNAAAAAMMMITHTQQRRGS